MSLCPAASSLCNFPCRNRDLRPIRSELATDGSVPSVFAMRLPSLKTSSSSRLSSLSAAVPKRALAEDLELRAQVLRPEEAPGTILVAEDVVARVLKQHCTGMEFSHPENFQSGPRVDRYRTLDGMAERDVHRNRTLS